MRLHFHAAGRAGDCTVPSTGGENGGPGGGLGYATSQRGEWGGVWKCGSSTSSRGDRGGVVGVVDCGALVAVHAALQQPGGGSATRAPLSAVVLVARRQPRIGSGIARLWWESRTTCYPCAREPLEHGSGWGGTYSKAMKGHGGRGRYTVQ